MNRVVHRKCKHFLIRARVLQNQLFYTRFRTGSIRLQSWHEPVPLIQQDFEIRSIPYLKMWSQK